jgi:hypothetical protein
MLKTAKAIAQFLLGIVGLILCTNSFCSPLRLHGMVDFVAGLSRHFQGTPALLFDLCLAVSQRGRTATS